MHHTETPIPPSPPTLIINQEAQNLHQDSSASGSGGAENGQRAPVLPYFLRQVRVRSGLHGTHAVWHTHMVASRTEFSRLDSFNSRFCHPTAPPGRRPPAPAVSPTAAPPAPTTNPYIPPQQRYQQYPHQSYPVYGPSPQPPF